DVEIAFVYLDADESAAQVDAGDASGAGAHEGVEDGAGVGEEAEAPFHEGDGLLRRMLLSVLHRLAASIGKDADGVPLRGPSQFHVREREVALAFVPSEPSHGRRQ